MDNGYLSAFCTKRVGDVRGIKTEGEISLLRGEVVTDQTIAVGGVLSPLLRTEEHEGEVVEVTQLLTF